MTTIKDLRKTIDAAYKHLNIGGILLIVAHMRDNFKENNFAYTGKSKDTKVTIFENNYITGNNSYEATIVYLVRRKKKLKIYTDIHTIGLFDLKTWTAILKDRGFKSKKINLNNMYDRFMLNDGEYPQLLFICRKTK